MKLNKTHLMIVAALAIVALIGLNGCKEDSDTPDVDGKIKDVSGDAEKGAKDVTDAAKEALCPKCGLVKGSEFCCKPKCPKCDMPKGSPACCPKMPDVKVPKVGG